MTSDKQLLYTYWSVQPLLTKDLSNFKPLIEHIQILQEYLQQELSCSFIGAISKPKTKWFVQQSLEGTHIITDLVFIFNRVFCALPLCDCFRIFSLSLLNCRFILSSLCIYLKSHFVHFLLHGNFAFPLFLEILHPCSFFCFISLKYFFPSFLATLQTQFFTNIMAGLESSVTHNMLCDTHNCNLWPKKEQINISIWATAHLPTPNSTTVN